MDKRSLYIVPILTTTIFLSSCSLPVKGCTAIGSQEGVSVSLIDVLDPEGGDYFAEVGVEELSVSKTTGFAGNDEYPLAGSVDADLTEDDVTVYVVVRNENNEIVYSTEDTATPVLHQPNGPQCDGKNYRIELNADKEENLNPVKSSR